MLRQPLRVLTSISRNFKVHNANIMLCTSSQDNIEDEKEKELQKIAKDASIDNPPTACCRAGCSNCVFIVWAEAIAAKMDNASPEVVKKIMENVDDPSMKAFLEMELRIRGLNK